MSRDNATIPCERYITARVCRRQCWRNRVHSSSRRRAQTQVRKKFFFEKPTANALFSLSWNVASTQTPANRRLIRLRDCVSRSDSLDWFVITKFKVRLRHQAFECNPNHTRSFCSMSAKHACWPICFLLAKIYSRIWFMFYLLLSLSGLKTAT